MAITNYSFAAWNGTYTYSKWDVLYGSSATDTRYFYSTADNNLGADPNAQMVFVPLSATRTDDVVRLTFRQTGTAYFQPGSIVVVSGLSPDSTVNYTGTILAAGSGYVDYLNPGLNTTNVITAGGLKAPIHPYWTTGFYWIPGWSTEVNHDMAVINTKLGDGYSQRMTTAINSNSLSWNLVFQDRTDKETRSLLTFLQNKGGATPFVINLPIGNLYNLPGLKYITTPGQSPKHQMTSFGLSTVTVPVTQVFDL